ncbi:MAG: hypothetical protein FGM55_10880, partial [Rhodoferax sp.]|nr:hypothetical protein [Rhodoferax sp.]
SCPLRRRRRPRSRRCPPRRYRPGRWCWWCRPLPRRRCHCPRAGHPRRGGPCHAVRQRDRMCRPSRRRPRPGCGWSRCRRCPSRPRR